MARIHIIHGAYPIDRHPAVRKIRMSDLKEALARGIDDFAAMPTHAVFLCLIYPILGVVLAGMAFGYSVLPLLYPLMAGFALIGPIAALGLYELSRRRERGLDCFWTHAFDITQTPNFGAIAALGVVLLAIFVGWVATAQFIYEQIFGPQPPESITAFIDQIFTTRDGWMLIVVGNGVGFLFALLVLSISVVSFPLLLDRDVGAVEAAATSVRAVAANPMTMAAWGLIVAVLLVLGSLPLFLGLAVVMPVLGHATWHLYRKVVAR